MKIWEKEDDRAGLPTPAPGLKASPARSGEMEAFLGKGTVFDGILSFEGTIRLDGKLKGKIITGGVLVIGESAEVEAEIEVGHIIVNGLVKGDIKAKEKIEILGQGKVLGTINAPRLKVQEGAIFEGRCSMGKGPQPQPGPGKERKDAKEAG